MTLLHLATQREWDEGRRGGRYQPARFATDGFVHCCDDLETLRAIADAYYARVDGPLLVLELDEAALDVEVRREAPAPPDGQPRPHHDGRRFPHVYGTIPLSAVVRVTRLR